MDIDIKEYFEKLKARKQAANPTFKTRTQEIVAPYLQYLKWDNSDFFSQMTTFWVTMYAYRKRATEAQIKSLMEWAQIKSDSNNAFHVYQMVKIINNRINGKKKAIK